MPTINDVAHLELTWKQATVFKQEYTLLAGEQTLATLKFAGGLSATATAACDAGHWTFRRGFWRSKVTVYANDSAGELLTFQGNVWGNGGSLHLNDGRQYRTHSNFWGTRYEILQGEGEVLLRYHIHNGLRVGATLEITPAARRLPELALFAPLGWYLAVLRQSDTAGIAVVTACTSAVITTTLH